MTSTYIHNTHIHQVRLKRIENKIVNLLASEKEHTTEKVIRMYVGDNTGTGKAIRRLVCSGMCMYMYVCVCI